MKSQVIQNDALMRNIQTYEIDLDLNDVSETGIKEACFFNKIDSFYVTKNYAVDISHDIF